MVDMKHKNIGATAGISDIVKGLSPKFSEDVETDLLGALKELFGLESEECDYKDDKGMCGFKNDKSNVCSIEDCPLSEPSLEELNKVAKDIYGIEAKTDFSESLHIPGEGEK